MVERMLPVLRRVEFIGPYAGNPDKQHRQTGRRLLEAAELPEMLDEIREFESQIINQ